MAWPVHYVPVGMTGKHVRRAMRNFARLSGNGLLSRRDCIRYAGHQLDDDLFTPLSLRALVRRVRILYRTAVRTRRRHFHLLAGHGLLEGEINVVSRSNNVVQVGCRLVVDGAIIDHDT